MSLLIFLLVTFSAYVLCGPTILTHNSTSTCDDFQATFNISSVVGIWQLVAIIPEKLFPDKDIICYKVEFSETDGAALSWLINKTKTTKDDNGTVDYIEGTSIRQRCYLEDPIDVWSKSVKGVNGCFQQVLLLDVGVNVKHKTLTRDAMMQLHLVEAGDKSGPFLLQILWGRLVSGAIYRRRSEPPVTQDQLKPVFELMSKLRGPQRLPKICETPLNI